MVVRKYLCAAPRPDSWEAKAEALLKSLDGDKAKREQFARQTLDLLKERRKHEKKKAGPGRKSNAEHAIAFYEYLVGFQEDENDNDNNPNDENDNNSDDDDDENSSTTSSSSSTDSSTDSSDNETLDTEEFLNQHDNVCDVCVLGGRLICCSTCTLSFHQACVRPMLRMIPSDWSCPHCITQGIKNYKRHSKTWKAAAAGIRQMKRMKSEREIPGVGAAQQPDDNDDNDNNDNDNNDNNNDNNNNNSEDVTRDEGNTIKTGNEDSSKERKAAETESSSNKDDKNHSEAETAEEKSEHAQHSEQETSKEPASSARKQNPNATSKTKPIPSATGNVSAASSVSTAESRRNLALFKLADSYTPDSTDNLLVRGRRQRKQPSLYQPQLCADSRWKSDEKIRDGNNNNNNNNTDNYTDSDVNRSAKQTAKTQKTRGAENENENEMENNIIICVGTAEGEQRKSDHSSSPFCNFCRDDPAIPICVFCGCRVCFGKHDKATLLLCDSDSCDNEYHIRCLGLATVPKTPKWYCPDCDQTKYNTSNTVDVTTTTNVISTRRASYGTKASTNSDVDAEETSRRNTPSKKHRTAARTSTPTGTKSTPVPAEASGRRGRGRPPKTRVEKEVPPPTSLLSPRKRVKTPKAAAISSEVTEQQQQQQQQQRKRGRPPKSATTAPSSSSSTGSTPSSGRKRGRPSKGAATTETHSASSKPKPTTTITPRKRGRPPKTAPEPAAIASKVDSTGKKKAPKPTIPSSSAASIKTASSSSAPEAPAKHQEPVKVVSRVSGRTVKRASFHDEVDEGEQHLRASKPSLSSTTESHSTSNNTSKSMVSKSQESHSHDRGPKEATNNNKVPEPSEQPTRKKQKVDASEPTRKKQKVDSTEPTITTRKKQKIDASEPTRKTQKVVVEERVPSQSKVVPNSSEKTTTKIKIPPTKDDEEILILDAPPLAPVRMKPVLDPPAPPIAPVRMKPVLDPPAPPIAPVRMKPVLEPPVPPIRPPVAVSNNPAPTEKIEKQEARRQDSTTVANSVTDNEVKKVSKDKYPVAHTAVPAAAKPEATKKTESQPPAVLPPVVKPAKTAAAAAASVPTATAAVATSTTENATISTNTIRKSTPALTNEPSIGTSKPTASTSTSTSTPAVPNYPSIHLLDPVALEAAIKALPEPEDKGPKPGTTKVPRRKPGARECMQISRRFGVNIIPEKYMRTLLDYCRRGKVEHLIKMRERLDCHSRFLESQLAGLEARVKEVGESRAVVPALPPHKRESSGRQRGGGGTSPTLPLSAQHKRPVATATATTTTTAPSVASYSGAAIGKQKLSQVAPNNRPATARAPPAVAVAPQVSPAVTATAVIAANTKLASASNTPRLSQATAAAATATKPIATGAVAPVSLAVGVAAAPRPTVPAPTAASTTKTA